MKKTMLLVTVILLGAMTQINAQSENDGWIVIAEKTASFKNDLDKVTPYGEERNVSKIKIKCIQGTIKLHKVHVTMSDGTKKSYDAKGIGVLNKGMTSFAFTLPGDSKLEHIELEYDSAGMLLVTKKAKVQILGKKRKKDKDEDKDK